MPLKRFNLNHIVKNFGHFDQGDKRWKFPGLPELEFKTSRKQKSFLVYFPYILFQQGQRNSTFLTSATFLTTCYLISIK